MSDILKINIVSKEIVSVRDFLKIERTLVPMYNALKLNVVSLFFYGYIVFEIAIKKEGATVFQALSSWYSFCFFMFLLVVNLGNYVFYFFYFKKNRFKFVEIGSNIFFYKGKKYRIKKIEFRGPCVFIWANSFLHFRVTIWTRGEEESKALGQKIFNCYHREER